MKSSAFDFWQFNFFQNSYSEWKIKNFILNFGVQCCVFPDILHLVKKLNRELVKRTHLPVDFLRRNVEKLMETRNYLKLLLYFNLLDYVPMMTQKDMFYIAIEFLLKTISIELYYLIAY